MTSASLRICAAMLAVLLLAACGVEPAADPDPAGDPAAGEPGPEPDETAAAPDRNPTECVDDFAQGVDYFPDKVEFAHASGVEVSYADTHKLVEVVRPFDEAGDPLRYVLLQCGAPEPELDGDWAQAQILSVPAAQAVSLTTSNLPHFAELDAVDRLVGVGTPDFVSTQAVVDAIEAGEVGQYADAMGQPEVEALIGASPDLLVMDGFGEAILDEAARLAETGVPTVLNADFYETSLLGRAEWLKFTALFLNAEAQAEAAFADIADRYAEVAAAAAGAGDAPTVFVDMPYEGTWHAPGGQSFFASGIADAGGDYVFSDDESTGSTAFDIETVLDRASDADIWIQAGSVHGTLDDLLAVDERFANFKAFQDGQVWAADAITTPGGGNARFEQAYMRADLFLADLVTIFHPDALDDHELVFFARVPSGG